jgi:hypothetical protein
MCRCKQPEYKEQGFLCRLMRCRRTLHITATLAGHRQSDRHVPTAIDNESGRPIRWLLLTSSCSLRPAEVHRMCIRSVERRPRDLIYHFWSSPGTCLPPGQVGMRPIFFFRTMQEDCTCLIKNKKKASAGQSTWLRWTETINSRLGWKQEQSKLKTVQIYNII